MTKRREIDIAVEQNGRFGGIGRCCRSARSRAAAGDAVPAPAFALCQNVAVDRQRRARRPRRGRELDPAPGSRAAGASAGRAAFAAGISSIAAGGDGDVVIEGRLGSTRNC